MKNLLIALTLVSVFACEKDIRPDLGDPINAIVIDAWLNDRDVEQHISITRSQPYFEREFPTKIPNATVWVVDSEGQRFDFMEGDSTYIWSSPDGTPLAQPNSVYHLHALIGGTLFESVTYMGRVPEIDSIKFFYRPADLFITEDFYFAEFYARDPVGQGDTYWIRSWKNGIYLDKPAEINVAFDAGFSAGGAVDGIIFIQPIRTTINPFDQRADDSFIPPFLPGDSVYVEIHSISLSAFEFFAQVILQTNRDGGFAALFATPLANVNTNIFTQDQSTTEKVVGFFNVGAVSSAGLLLTEELAALAREEYERGDNL